MTVEAPKPGPEDQKPTQPAIPIVTRQGTPGITAGDGSQDYITPPNPAPVLPIRIPTPPPEEKVKNN